MLFSSHLDVLFLHRQHLLPRAQLSMQLASGTAAHQLGGAARKEVVLQASPLLIQGKNSQQQEVYSPFKTSNTQAQEEGI